MTSYINGSSPRMRGTDMPVAAGDLDVRFIPAHAGNRQGNGQCICSLLVHPRACGEQILAFLALLALAGSSPRMRGTGRHGYQQVRGLRFIPAHAGNRAAWIPASSRTTVHPRACGEQIHDTDGHALHSGSSPRMRGTARCHHPADRPGRFIPAHAGNSASGSVRT